MRSVSQLAKTAESSVAPIAAVGYPSSHTNIPANTNRVATYSATYTVTWMPSRSGSLPEATPSIIANAAARHAGNLPASSEITGYAASALVYLHSVTHDARYLPRPPSAARYQDRRGPRGAGV